MHSSALRTGEKCGILKENMDTGGIPMNNVSAHRAFSFLRTYGYERVSCSKEERTVAEALLNECTS